MTRLKITGFFVLTFSLLFSVSNRAATTLPSSVTETVKLVDTNRETYEYFGNSVAIFGDWAIVGNASDNEIGMDGGSASIFARRDGTWQLEVKLTPDDLQAEDYFGGQVDISGDIAIVTSRQGLYSYVYNGHNWVFDAKITDLRGTVDLDGNRVLIGDPFDDDIAENAGAGYIYEREESIWTQKSKLVTSTARRNDYMGQQVVLSGEWAVLQSDILNNGSVKLFRHVDGIWTYQGGFGGYGDDDGFGEGFTLSEDWLMVYSEYNPFVSAFRNGAIDVYQYDRMTWQSTTLTIVPPTEDEHFGSQLAVDGNRLLIGSPGKGQGIGFVYVYEFDGANWVEVSRLRATDERPFDQFSLPDLALDGNRAIIGADGDDTAMGSAYIFDLVALGDCNADNVFDSDDLLTLRLELFDGDGIDAAHVGSGTFNSAPLGCDANGDSAIDAGDLACVANILNSGDSCIP